MPLLGLALLVPQLVMAQTTHETVYPDRVVLDAAAIVRDYGVRSMTELLTSRVPGLLVVPGSGLTGAGAQLRFAGLRTAFGVGAPLILLDGMRIDAAEDAAVLALDGPGPLRLDDIDIESIESVEILRGPVSGALYGPGSATGVILIHSKQPESESWRWQTHGQGSVLVHASRWPTNYGAVDADNLNPWFRRGYCDLVLQADGQCTQDYQQSFNPFEQRRPFATPIERRAGFSGSGGTRWGLVRLSADFAGTGSAYASTQVPSYDNDYVRAVVGGNALLRPLRGVELQLGASRVDSKLGLPVYRPVYSALSGPSDSTGFVWDSAGAQYQIAPPMQSTDRDALTAEARFKPWSWLVGRIRHGFDDVASGERTELRYPTGFPYVSYVQIARRQVRQSTTQAEVAATLQWRRTRFTTTVGTERLGYRLTRSQEVISDTASMSSAKTVMWRNTVGWFGVEDVAVGERFHIVAAVRTDRFKEMRRSKAHQSVAVSWVARSADSARGVLGRVQLRAAYGSAGSLNFSGIESADFFAILVPFERTRGFEVGAAAELLNARWTTHLTLYDQRSDASDVSYAPSYGYPGFGYYVPNALELSNRGIVATLSGAVIDHASWTWRAQISVWGNRNRVEKGPVRYRSMPGYPFGGYWAPALDWFADANGDGVIVPTEVARTEYRWAGTPYPTQGVLFTSTWRIGARLHAATTFDYRAGHTLLNERQWWRCSAGLPVCRQRYDPGTPLADQAVAVGAGPGPIVNYYEDADYLKLREIALTLDVPPTTAALIRARTASVTLSARDLFTWTRYSGGDPEAGSYVRMRDPSGAVSPQIADQGAVPLPRSWSLGVRIGF